jgi:hypothetical protein
VAWVSSGAQPRKANPLAVMSVYGRGLLLAVEKLLVELLEDEEDTVEVVDDEETVVEDDGDAVELLELDDTDETLDDVVLLDVEDKVELEEIATWYKFKTDLPPQYSFALFAHTILQGLEFGTVIELTDPALRKSPQ